VHGRHLVAGDDLLQPGQEGRHLPGRDHVLLELERGLVVNVAVELDQVVARLEIAPVHHLAGKADRLDDQLFPHPAEP
jgi:hypothetical protein